MSCISFIHSSVDGHLDCFHLLVIVNNVSVSIDIQIFESCLNYLEYILTNGVVESDGNYMYPGNKRLMRDYFVIYLWRMAGSPKVDLKYADILGGYTVKSRRAVAWVTKEGIVKGYKNNPITFHRMLTRKEAMIMLWRYAGKPKVSGKMPFKDVTYKKTSDSYQAILWATQKGITSGKTKTTFVPDETCTRGQALTFLYRYAKKIK